MAVLKNIAKLSDKDAKTREALFEAEMLAMVAQGAPPNPVASPRPPAASAPTSSDAIWPPLEATASPTPSPEISSVVPAPVVNGIRISVTANGQTSQYNNLESVPGSIRQHIMSAWIGSPVSTVPPMLSAPAFRNAPPSPSSRMPRPKTMKMAMFLNLIVPGAGQFYLGQRLAGAVYTLTFLASFAAAFGIFVHGYFSYLNLSTSGDIL